MRKIATTIFLLAGPTFVFANPQQRTFYFNGDDYEISIESNAVAAKKNGKAIFYRKTGGEEAIGLDDFNFDGYPDISILRDSGVEKYYDVYIFDKSSAEFKINNQISSLACPAPDKKNHTIIAECNHASACNNWMETYRFIKDKIVLVRRDGTDCDPTTGAAFSYTEIYKNGKISWQKTLEFKSTK